MLDGFTLDQLRTFIAAVDEGSFSAAGRKLGQAQSAVSQTLATLEGQLGVTLFDRGGRLPVLTEQGQALIAEARAAAGGMDQFKARAKSLAGGLEAELSVVVDVMLPTAPPHVTLERLLGVPMTMVAAPQHPLAAHPGPIPSDMLAQHIQLVLTDRSDLSSGREFGVMAATTWRIADLGAKHAFLRAGLGWGSMPLNVVEADIADGALVALKFEDGPPSGGFVMPLSAVYPTASPPGPAGRWLIDRLKLEALGQDEGDA